MAGAYTSHTVSAEWVTLAGGTDVTILHSMGMGMSIGPSEAAIPTEISAVIPAPGGMGMSIGMGLFSYLHDMSHLPVPEEDALLTTLAKVTQAQAEATVARAAAAAAAAAAKATLQPSSAAGATAAAGDAAEEAAIVTAAAVATAAAAAAQERLSRLEGQASWGVRMRWVAEYGCEMRMRNVKYGCE